MGTLTALSPAATVKTTNISAISAHLARSLACAKDIARYVFVVFVFETFSDFSNIGNFTESDLANQVATERSAVRAGKVASPNECIHKSPERLYKRTL